MTLHQRRGWIGEVRRTVAVSRSAAFVAVLATVLSVVGCSKAPSTSTDTSATPSADGNARPEDSSVPSFASATSEDVGNDQLFPVESTRAGKRTAAVRAQVEQAWPTIRFPTDGTDPRVTLETSEGTIEITLSAGHAPNNVRNFLALARCGYYDGLLFDRLVRQTAVAMDGTRSQLDLVKAGCPAGTGDPGIGHLGYLVRPEIAKDVKHEAGTVGMWHDGEAEGAGVRFYMTLGPAPLLDGHFTIIGKVTRGMDVLKRISLGEVLPPESDPTGEMPVKPVLIKKAICTEAGVAEGPALSQNSRE